jgi:hypothetical protein
MGDGFGNGNDIDLLDDAEDAYVLGGGTLVDLNGDGEEGIVLAPGECFEFEFTLTFPMSLPGSYTNTVEVCGEDDEDNETCDEDSDTLVGFLPSLITNSSLCEFDFDSTLPGDQFRILYVNESSSTYRLNSTNPGQFYYNVFYVAGTPGETVTITAEIPYPFVTQGAQPMHVYSDFEIVDTDPGPGQMLCITPVGDVTSDFTLSSEGGNLSSSGAPIIKLGDYGTGAIPGVTTTTVTATGVIPATGRVYLNIHLDFGFKRTSGWRRANLDGIDTLATDAYRDLNGSNSADPNEILYGVGPAAYQPQSYAFAFSGSDTGGGGVTDDEVTQSVNIFKKSVGVAGAVTGVSTASAMAGYTVKFYNSSNTLIEKRTTDSDGYYFFNYKHTSAAKTFYVRLYDPANMLVATKAITLKANGFVICDFQVADLLAWPLSV